MISTPTGILFEGYSYDPNEQCNPAALTEIVSLSATNNLFATSHQHSVESWLDLVWWFRIEVDPLVVPEDFVPAGASFGDWIAQYIKARALVLAPLQVPRNTFREGLPRRSAPVDRFKDRIYLLLSWVSFRKTTTLDLSIVEKGSISINLRLLAAMEIPFPLTVGAGRSLYLGVEVGAEAEALPAKTLVSGVVE